MKVYYDCEFLEDGRTIELISIGMVAEDGRELYAVFEEAARDPLHRRILKHRWLMENVLPHLPLRAPRGSRTHAYYPPGVVPGTSFFHLDMDSNLVMPRRMIRNAVREFILATPDVELWAWYGAYDHVALCQLWGAMVDLPDGIPKWTNDFKQEVHRLGNPGLPEQDGGEHHALADALHLKARADWLAELQAR